MLIGRILCALFGIGFICGGGLGLWNAVWNTSQLDMSCDAYLAQRPIKSWVQLSGCELNYDEAEWILNPAYARHKSNQPLKAVYVPVHGSTPGSGPTVLVMKLGDTGVKTLQDFLISAGGLKPQQSVAEAAKSAMLVHGMPLRQPRVLLTGMADTAPLRDDQVAVAPLAETWRLNSEWTLLEAERNPSWLKGLGELLGGLMLIVVALARSGGSKA
jgi:hypothetical protein